MQYFQVNAPTEDFYTFRVLTLYGEGSLGKGMALFPKKINGKYAMLGRMDGVNNYLMYSVRPNEWKKSATDPET